MSNWREELSKKYNASQVSCGDGWRVIVEELAVIIARQGAEMEQVKEKFGTLRCYTSDDGDAIIRGAVLLAEALSSRTCEYCGSSGNRVITNGWAKTLCDDCHKERVRK